MAPLDSLDARFVNAITERPVMQSNYSFMFNISRRAHAVASLSPQLAVLAFDFITTPCILLSFLARQDWIKERDAMLWHVPPQIFEAVEFLSHDQRVDW